MSWERAQKEARRWVDGLNLPTRFMQGKTVDLTAQAAALKLEPKFKLMVLRAAKRLLKTRGVEAIIPQPEGEPPPP